MEREGRCKMEWLTSSGKVRIEIKSRGNRSSWRWLFRVPCQQTEDVIAPPMPCFDHQTQVRRQSTVVGRSGSFIVFVGFRYIVRELARPLLNLAFVIGLSVVFILFCHCLHLVDRVGVANHIPPRNAGERMAGGANFAVDLEATAETVAGIRM